ncbi:hypothetical protein SAMN05216216_11511 [Lacicoccus qingdaonensis]|uniref:Uncharacterized protein n=1 Tax=Lacicoccus qingdaonensis TaxID=576118 RepID=A0A1G9G2X0_9BACL|nr:hypothetical protein SAMN05216216_11511 [Salinicoccus qingdaonensis]
MNNKKFLTVLMQRGQGRSMSVHDFGKPAGVY